MKQVNIHEAKTHFSKLVKAAMDGKTTIIARGGKPVAKIVPLKQVTSKRQLGLLAHKIKLPEGFDIKNIELSDEEQQAFGMTDN